MSILLTGASGFVGKGIIRGSVDHGVGAFRFVYRKLPLVKSCDLAIISEIDGETDWSGALDSIGVVIHAAARAHVLHESCSNPLDAFRKVNVAGTLNLAAQAAQAGVKRFIFISSIGVNGNINTRPFSEDDEPNPSDPYAQSKWEAERGLWEIQHETDMEVVIIRPPLVYGPNAPGNFGSLVRLVEKGVPLPLGAIHNRRSLVALDNLVDLVITCIDHPAAGNQLFLAGDGQDLSTTELLRGVGEAMGKPARLIPVPAGMLMVGASLFGKNAIAQRVLGSLQVDISKARNLLGWEPPLSVEEGLRRCFDSENSF